MLAASIPERKGLCIKFTLGDLFTNESYCKEMDLFRVDPKEAIVGVLPPFTLGTGVSVMSYLKSDELLNGFLLSLDETSMAGHVVPGYPTILEKGVGGLLQEARGLLDKTLAALKDMPKGEKRLAWGQKRQFYQSAVSALEGVQAYFRNYATFPDWGLRW